MPVYIKQEDVEEDGTGFAVESQLLRIIESARTQGMDYFCGIGPGYVPGVFPGRLKTSVGNTKFITGFIGGGVDAYADKTEEVV